MFDVIQIGYGPVSQALAMMLGRQGRSVLVCERWKIRYPLPRAVCIDHELYRVLASNGMHDVLPTVTQPGPIYRWFNAEWRELLAIDWSASSISGGPEVNFVHQPTLEEALDRKVAEQSSVETWLGWEAEAVRQTVDFAEVDVRNTDTGEVRTVRSRYVVGCDGANSLVRRAIGGDREDRGFEADWLVIDALLKPGVTIETLGIPAAGQYCNPARPTTIVPAGTRNGRTFRRWEFMRLPGESVQSMEREEQVWDWLRPWAGPGEVELVRHKVYNFRSLLASRWRSGRLLLAGDAAHVMPPFMGQGMCSGMRDSWNLAWRLGLILDGLADDRLLDGYQAERAPHVSQIIDMSIYLGKIICIPDKIAAAARDDAFLSGRVEPMPPFPALTTGLISWAADGLPAPGSGLLSPHVEMAGADFTGRLDDLTGPGFVAITRGFDAGPALDAAGLGRLKIAVVNLDRYHDCDGRLDSFLSGLGWAAMIVRPDYYIYGGGADEAAFTALARSLADDLRAAGVRLQTAVTEGAAA